MSALVPGQAPVTAMDIGKDTADTKADIGVVMAIAPVAASSRTAIGSANSVALGVVTEHKHQLLKEVRRNAPGSFIVSPLARRARVQPEYAAGAIAQASRFFCFPIWRVLGALLAAPLLAIFKLLRIE